MITLPCPRCYELARALGEARLERDALRAAVRAERLAATEHAATADRGDVVEARAWRGRRIDAERALLALLPPEAAP